MIEAIYLALGSGVANAGVAVAAKAAERNACRVIPYAAMTLGTAGVTACVAALLTHGAWGGGRLWALGVVLGLIYIGAVGSVLWANRVWAPSLVWSMANMAFLLPILCSALLLHESLHWLDLAIVAGFAVMLLGLLPPRAKGNAPAPRATAWQWLTLGAVFLTNGLLMFGFKLHTFYAPHASTACLSAIMCGCGCLVSWGLSLGIRKTAVLRAEVGWGMATGVATGAAILALLPAMHLPAMVAFPLIQGTSLAGGVALCAVIYREPWSLRKTAALLIGIATLLLAGMRRG